MPAGRPTDYRPEFCEIVIRQMSKGAAIQELPFYLGVCEDTIYQWQQKHEEFAEAIKKGKCFSKAVWYRKGRLNLKDQKFNYTGWYMQMKNRFGWTDKQEINATIDVGENARENMQKY